MILLSVTMTPIGVMAAPEKAISKKEYEKIVKDRNLGSEFAAREMDAGDVEFLDAVRSNWNLRTSSCPDEVFAKMAEITGVSVDVRGVVALYTHKTPPFSGDDDHRNLVEAEIAAVLTVSLPTTMDNLIYVKPGVAYIRHSEKSVTVYEDTAKGLKCDFYSKSDKD